LGRGVTATMGRRKEALELERVWLRERKANEAQVQYSAKKLVKSGLEEC
jgi:hypothetical protein